MRIKQVTIATRAGGELNVKQSAYEQLLPYKDDPDIYISFTDVDKIGINPQSRYNTPLGIYTYPLQVAWHEYGIGENKDFRDVPFAEKRPYIWVIRSTSDHVLCNAPDNYTNAMFKNDIKRMEVIFKGEYKGAKVDTDWLMVIDHANTYLSRFTSNPSPLQTFWSVTFHAVKTLIGDTETIQFATRWNKLFRQLGYAGIADKLAAGIIHQNEPLQAVFFSTSAFKVVTKILNRAFTAEGDMPLSPEQLDKVHTFQEFIRALIEARSSMYSNMKKRLVYYPALKFLLANSAKAQQLKATIVDVDVKILKYVIKREMNMLKNLGKDLDKFKRLWLQFEQSVKGKMIKMDSAKYMESTYANCETFYKVINQLIKDHHYIEYNLEEKSSTVIQSYYIGLLKWLNADGPTAERLKNTIRSASYLDFVHEMHKYLDRGDAKKTVLFKSELLNFRYSLPVEVTGPHEPAMYKMPKNKVYKQSQLEAP